MTSVNIYSLAIELYRKVTESKPDIDERCTLLIQTTVPWACSEDEGLHEALSRFYDLLSGSELQWDTEFDIKTSALALRIEIVPAKAVEAYKRLRRNILEEISVAPNFDKAKIATFVRLYNLKDGHD